MLSNRPHALKVAFPEKKQRQVSVKSDYEVATLRRGNFTLTDPGTVNLSVYKAASVDSQYSYVHLFPAEALALLHVFARAQPRSILDLGVGAGRTARYLVELAERYQALDYSPVMIARVKRDLPHVDVQLGDMRDLAPVADQSFDLVVASANVIDAVSHDDRIKVLREVHRVLRPQGIFLFSSHNRNYRRAFDRPRLRLSRNPVTIALNVGTLARQLVNYALTISMRAVTEDYALLTDEGHHYRVLHYYITRFTQRLQLKQAGFSLERVIDKSIRSVKDDDDDSQSSDLHYIAVRD